MDIPVEEARTIATKTVANVVKALIGAAKVAEGDGNALACAKALLCEIDLPSLYVGRRQLFDACPCDVPLPTTLAPLEALVGYSFTKKALLVEAMTHCTDATAHACYGRLAFLGDALIEGIVSDVIYQHSSSLSKTQMHLYRAAVVNESYLGFVAMDWHTALKRVHVCPSSGYSPASKEVLVDVPFWKFMVFFSGEVEDEMEAAQARFASLQNDIKQALEAGDCHPWELLARVRANGFFADIVKSLVAAIWVDSGSMTFCSRVLEQMGILAYLRRILAKEVRVTNPLEELRVLAGSEEIKWSNNKGATNKTRHAVYIGSRLVADFISENGKDDMRMQLAVAAVSVLRRQ